MLKTKSAKTEFVIVSFAICEISFIQIYLQPRSNFRNVATKRIWDERSLSEDQNRFLAANF